MLAAGIDVKVVSETLGHSDTQITRDIYRSVLDDPADGSRQPRPVAPGSRLYAKVTRRRKDDLPDAGKKEPRPAGI